MKRHKFERIGVAANLDKKGVSGLLGVLVPALVKEGFEIRVEPDVASALPDDVAVKEGVNGQCDLIVAMGGDGTILRVARDYADDEVPIMGIKAGRVGFLTESMTPNTIPRIKSGEVEVQDRMRITATVMKGDEAVTTFGALNDVVVHAAGYSRMVALRTDVDGTFAREYSADGVIVATPTGSTAYSLSAGGPLLAPTIQAILITPLCPHTLTVRPVVLDANEQVAVHVLSPDADVRVTVDGQQGHDLQPGEYVVIQKSEKVTKLVVPDQYDFFGLLREKL